MAGFEPQDPDFESRIRESFARQSVMQTIAAALGSVSPGVVEIRLPYSDRLTQQDGYLHAGIVSTIADSACGYAAYTLAPARSSVLTVEFKVNLTAPSRGEMFVATGRVLKAGRTLTVCEGRVLASGAGAPPGPVLVMLATLMILRPEAL